MALRQKVLAPVAEIKPHNGVPTVFVDGRPTFYYLAWFPAPARKTDDAFRRAVGMLAHRTGVHLYTFENGAGRLGPAEHLWMPGPGPGREDYCDFSHVESDFHAFLDADPEARFHIRLFLDLNPEWVEDRWWARLHPEECLINSEGWQPECSFASTVWRDHVNDFLRKFIAHVDRIGLADRVLAYQVNTGTTCEWFKYALGVGDLCGDFSPPMARYFRA
jgi:hypothetical protein